MMKSKNPPFKIAVILTLAVFVLLAALVIVNNMKSKSNSETTYDKQPPIEGQPTLGEADAPITVVEFGDFKCPSCKAWGKPFIDN